jgi:hypothetical protein
MEMRDIRNYWYAGSPLGGRSKTATGHASAINLDGYMAPLRLQRIKQDPITWKQALEESEVPVPLLSYRVKMIQMVNDTFLDAQTFSCWEKRKERITLKDIHIVDEKGEEDEQATKIVNKSWYKSIIGHALDAKAFGYTLLQIGDIVDGEPVKIKLIRRQNVSPDRLNLAPVPYSPGGIQFMDENDKDSEGRSFKDWTIWCPTPSDFGISECGYGLLYKVALYQILLRNNLGDNATHNELFGQPIRKATTNKKDALAREILRQNLDSMGSSAWIIMDEEDKLELLSSSTGAGAAKGPYENFEDRLEKKISKIIFGHADAIDSTAGKLGSSGKDDDGVGKALTDKEKQDTDFIDNFMNDIVNPKLIKLGVKLPIGKRFAFKNDIEKQKAAAAKVKANLDFMTFAKTAKEAGLKIPANVAEEFTGIKVEEIEEPMPPTLNNPNIRPAIKNKLEGMYK